LRGVRRLRKRKKKMISEEDGGDDKLKEELDIVPIE
jgi:hypothetical protein